MALGRGDGNIKELESHMSHKSVKRICVASVGKSKFIRRTVTLTSEYEELLGCPEYAIFEWVVGFI